MINLNNALKGMKEVFVKGKATSRLRKEKIEEAITLSLEDPKWETFKSEGVRQIFGVKNYNGFGDQGCDCKEGYGPRHGHIVFSVGWKSVVGKNGIYLLKLCAENTNIDICESLLEYTKLTSELRQLEEKINKFQEFQDK